MERKMTLAVLALGSALACGASLIAASINTSSGRGFQLSDSDAFGFAIVFGSVFCVLCLLSILELYFVNKTD